MRCHSHLVVCVLLLPGTTAVSIAEAEASWSCWCVCVPALSLLTREHTAGGWHSYEGDLQRHALLLCDALPASSTASQQPAAAANQVGEGRSSAVHLRDIVSPYSTGWGRTAVPEACGGWVALTTRQFLTGSTRPSVKKQSELLPSTEFPDPSPSSYRV